jgi:hypothetical protein
MMARPNSRVVPNRTGFDPCTHHGVKKNGVCTFLASEIEESSRTQIGGREYGMEDPRRLRLPDDVLADVLARLAPRCVCREWRAVVDDRCRQLLRPDLLPLTVGGIFVESYETYGPDFFARPSMARRVAGRLESFVRMDLDGFGAEYIEIVDCCNGRAPPARGTRGRRGEPSDETVGALASLRRLARGPRGRRFVLVLSCVRSNGVAALRGDFDAASFQPRRGQETIGRVAVAAAGVRHACLLV